MATQTHNATTDTFACQTFWFWTSLVDEFEKALKEQEKSIESPLYYHQSEVTQALQLRDQLIRNPFIPHTLHCDKASYGIMPGVAITGAELKVLLAAMGLWHQWTGFQEHEDGGYCGEPPAGFNQFGKLMQEHILPLLTILGVKGTLFGHGASRRPTAYLGQGDFMTKLVQVSSRNELQALASQTKYDPIKIW